MMGEVLVGHMRAFGNSSKHDVEATIEATFLANLAGFYLFILFYFYFIFYFYTYI